MAANANSENSFKQLLDCFSSLNEDLKRWYKACILQRCEVENKAQTCRKLLKPWPSEKKDQESQDGAESQTHTTEDKIPLKDEEKPDPDLALLDKILEKAQKARDIQSKIDFANSSSGTKKCHKTTQDAHILTKQTKSDPKSATKSKQDKKTKSVTMHTKSIATTRPPSSKTIVKQPVLLRKSKSVALKTTYGATYGRPVTGRPVSGGRAQSMKSTVTVTANTPLSIQEDSKEKPKCLKGKDLRENKPTVDKEKGPKNVDSRESSENPSVSSTPSKSTIDDETRQNDAQDDSDFVERAKRELSRISEDLKDIHARKQEFSKRDKIKADIQCEKPRNENKIEAEISQFERPFLLSEEGHTLALPSKYRKLKSSHYKLVSKLIKDSRTSDQCDNNFVKRLESQFDLNEAPCDLVQDKIIALKQAQSKLLVYLQWITEICSEDSEGFSWQNVYKSYRHWQVLLGKFRELQKGTQELLAAEEYQQRWCPCGGCVTTKELSSHFIRSKETNNSISSPRPACVLYSSWFVPKSAQADSAQDYFPNMECVTYEGEKELHILNESLHNLQLSEVDLHLQTHISKKGLDAIEGLDVTNRSFPLIYRALWGLICCHGKAFPSVVRHSSSD